MENKSGKRISVADILTGFICLGISLTVFLCFYPIVNNYLIPECEYCYDYSGRLAVALTDEIILKNNYGLSKKEIDLANSIWKKLLNRRLNRTTELPKHLNTHTHTHKHDN